MADQLLPYTVISAQHLFGRIRDWSTRMADQGLAEEFLEALKDMNRHLENDPADWGDFLWNYDHISARECRGMIPRWFLVWYGVEIPSRIVVVRDIRPAPGSPLEPPG